jgi:hypothetical protein
MSFSYIGYKILLLTMDKKSLTVSLEKMQINNEVVIQVGYGTVKKKDCRCSNSLTSEDFNKGPVTSVIK